MPSPANLAAVNAVQTKNTKLAASLIGLGFPVELDWLHDVSPQGKEGKTVLEFRFQQRSLRPEFASMSPAIGKDWECGALEKSDAMHPLCVAMRAQHNYDRVLGMQRGEVMNLRSTAWLGEPELNRPRMTVYRKASQFDPVTNFSPRHVPETDLALVASLAGVGLPVIAMDGAEGSRRYWLPENGYTLHDDKGMPLLASASDLIRRAPTARDPRRLALEDTHPLHPVCIAYDALNARALLKKVLERRNANLHIRHGKLEVIVSANHTGRVMDAISKRIGAPVITGF